MNSLINRFALAVAVLLSSAVPAFAHVEAGTWIGTTPAGASCSLLAGNQYFENNIQHPLNERIPIQVNGTQFIVGHPPVVSTTQPSAYFNHNMFQAVVPTSTGAMALVIDMVHQESYEGPTGYHVITQNWRTGAVTKMDCLNIKHQ